MPDVSPDPLPGSVGNCIESDHDSIPSPDISSEKSTLNSRALVAVPSMSVEALAVVPLTQKSRQSELVQRRIRRPFSVSEVEALVQAVEKFGTGRCVMTTLGFCFLPHQNCKLQMRGLINYFCRFSPFSCIDFYSMYCITDYF